MKKQMNIAKRGFALMTISWLLLHSQVQAASFDCEKASTSIERLICSQLQLSKLDDEMGDAYRAAMRSTQQAQEFKHRQFEWIKERNRCQTVECLVAIYQRRIQELGRPRANQSKKLGDWIYRDGVGGRENLCQALLKRLNHYARDERLNNSCSLPVIASYPEFTAPPWEELNTRRHEELVVKILKYSGEGPDGYFGSTSGTAQRNPDSTYVYRAKLAIEEGVRLRVWRTKLISHFSGKSGEVVAAGPTDQAVVQLLYPMAEEDEKAYCTGKPKPIGGSGVRLTFIFTLDLAGPDPAVDSATFTILSGHDPVIYQGKPVLIGVESLWQDGLVTLDGLCAFEFVTREK